MAENKVIEAKNLFNKEAAVAALKSTAIKAGGHGAAGTSELTSNIIACFKSAAQAGVEEISLNQLQAMYAAATGQELKAKVFADRCWTLSTKNSKAKNPVLKAGSAVGIYALI